MTETDINYFDEAKIYVKAGDGGNGIIHFRREKYVPRGGPDGGDGGRGGSVVLIVDTHINTLHRFRHKRRYIAQNGQHGGPSNRTGRGAKTLKVKVPPGTVVYDDDTGAILGDLTDPGQKLIVAKGGDGGRGNARFANSRNKAPRHAEKGFPGDERNLRLELKLIADIGIIGVPNAGKSTFLASVSNAKPKIAGYPFTTLSPNLGVAEIGNWDTVVLADIPGLIEGAHMGVGLGFAFLRHIQRCRVLIHLLDGLSENPVADFSQIMSELALFDDALAERLQVVALNKSDLPEVVERYDEVRQDLEAHGYEVMLVSAATSQGTRDLLNRANQLLAEAPPAPAFEAMPIYRPSDPDAFEITREDGGVYRVSGERIELAARQTYWEHDDARNRFQRILETLGIYDALLKAGVKEGDTVLIGNNELEWQD